MAMHSLTLSHPSSLPLLPAGPLSLIRTAFARWTLRFADNGSTANGNLQHRNSMLSLHPAVLATTMNSGRTTR